MSRIRVVVTAEDIATAAAFQDSDDPRKPQRCEACPLALALRRKYPAAIVNGIHWSPTGRWGADARDLGGEAEAFALQADLGKRVAPATFYLEGPDR